MRLAQAIWPFRAGHCNQTPLTVCSPILLTIDCKSGPTPPQTEIRGKRDTAWMLLAEGILMSASIARAAVNTAEPTHPAKNLNATHPGRVVANPMKRQDMKTPARPVSATGLRPNLSAAYPQKMLHVLPKK